MIRKTAKKAAFPDDLAWSSVRLLRRKPFLCAELTKCVTPIPLCKFVSPHYGTNFDAIECASACMYVCSFDISIREPLKQGRRNLMSLMHTLDLLPMETLNRKGRPKSLHVLDNVTFCS